jgi:glycosyltransferase involved in cell wall biosynthesis
LKVLAFADAFWPHVGGVETFLLDLATYLHKQGVEVAVVSRMAYHGDNPFAFPVHWQPPEDTLRELVDWCDLLHLNAMHVGLLLQAVSKRKTIVTTNHDVTMICPKGTKIRYDDGPCFDRAGPVVCMHCLRRSGIPDPWRKLVRPPLKGLLSALIHANVVTSPWAMSRFRMLHKRLIPLGIDVEHFSPGPEPANDRSRRLPRAIVVGRLIYDKGVHVLIEALRRCRDNGLPFELVICGEGPYAPELKSAVAAHDLRPLVDFRGVVRGEQLVTALRSADVAVVPSLWDNTPLSVIEAMSCGLPVIVSDIGALGSIAAELGPGLTFTSGDAAELAERLQSLLGDPVRQRSLGDSARRLALEKYDSKQMWRTYHELFASLTRNSGHDVDAAGQAEYPPRLRKAR